MRFYSESMYYALTFFICMCAYSCVLVHTYALACGSQTIALSVILRMLSADATSLTGVELTN